MVKARGVVDMGAVSDNTQQWFGSFIGSRVAKA